MGAGQFMAGREDCVLVCVTAGVPDPPQVTPFDTACGFAHSTAAMTARRAEDRAAAKLLQATTVHLGHLDGQYGTPLDPEAVADDIAKVLVDTGATMLLGPLGLAHPDHETTADAVLIAAETTAAELWLYEELPARVVWPELVAPALERVRMKGWDPQPAFPGTGDLAVKLRAIRCYRSQLAAVSKVAGASALHPVMCPERYYRCWPA